MKKGVNIICILILLFSCNATETNSNWSIAYKNNKTGNQILGSKKQLINAIRKGASIKIGWGTKGKSHQIEHLAEPIWIAVLDEKEVIAHLEPQVLSTTDWNNLTANYSDSITIRNEWRVVITTKGEFDAIWYDRKNNEMTKRIPQNHTITWFVKDIMNEETAMPLFSE